MRDLGTLGGIFSLGDSVAVDINEAGHVVGYASEPGTLTSHAFLFDGIQLITSERSPGEGLAMPVPSIMPEQSLDTPTLHRGNQHAFLFRMDNEGSWHLAGPHRKYCDLN